MRLEDMPAVAQAIMTEASVIEGREKRQRVELEGTGRWDPLEEEWLFEDAQTPRWQQGAGPVRALFEEDGEEIVMDMTMIPRRGKGLSLRPMDSMDSTDTEGERKTIGNVRVQPNTSWLTRAIYRSYVLQPHEEPSKYHERICSISEPSYEQHDFKPIESDELNASQCRAVGMATTVPETYIWGPPGTGKTHTLGHTIAELARQDKRVLITAATHKAVEELVKAARKHDIVRALEAKGELYWVPLQPGKDERRSAQSKTAKNPQLIFCTAHAALISRKIHNAIGAVPIDAAIVDEASMTVAPLTAAVAAKAKRHMIIVGDFRQIGPIIQAKKYAFPQVHHWLGRNIFYQARVAERVSDGPGKEDPRLVQLDEQYRAPKELCDFINTVSYGDAPMKTPPGVGETPAHAGPLGAHRLTYIDTSPAGAWASRAKNDRKGPRGPSSPMLTGSIANVVHAAIIRRLVEILKDADPDATIGIVAPYRDQKTAIQAQIMRGGNPTIEQVYGDVATAHAYQGGQRHTIVFDWTDGKYKPVERDNLREKPRRSGRTHQMNTEGLFFSGKALNDPGCGVLTVALSRAQARQVVVLDGPEVYDCSQPGSQTERVLTALQQHGQKVNVQEIFGEDMEQAISHGSDPAPQELIVKRLREAGSSIRWTSPWAPNTRPDPTVVEELKAAASRGVEVQVDVLETRDDEGPSLASHLREAGLKVGRTSSLGVEAIIVDQEWTIRPGWPALEKLDGNDKPRHVVALRDRELARQAQIVLEDRSIPWQRGPAKSKRPQNDPEGLAETRRKDTLEKEREATKENGRSLGCCPKPNCGKTLEVRDGRYGPFVGCSGYAAPKDQQCRYTRDLAPVERIARGLPPVDPRREKRLQDLRNSNKSNRRATTNVA